MWEFEKEVRWRMAAYISESPRFRENLENQELKHFSFLQKKLEHEVVLILIMLDTFSGSNVVKLHSQHEASFSLGLSTSQFFYFF